MRAKRMICCGSAIRRLPRSSRLKPQNAQASEQRSQTRQTITIERSSGIGDLSLAKKNGPPDWRPV
jgi:hypothetical protein